MYVPLYDLIVLPHIYFCFVQSPANDTLIEVLTMAGPVLAKRSTCNLCGHTSRGRPQPFEVVDKKYLTENRLGADQVEFVDISSIPVINAFGKICL